MCDAILYLKPTDTALKFTVYSYNSIFKNKKLASATFDLVNDTKDSTGREHTINLNSGTGILKVFVRVLMAERSELGTKSLPWAYIPSNLRINVERDVYLPGSTIRGTVAIYSKDPIKSTRLAIRLESLATHFQDFDSPCVDDWKLVHEAGATILDRTSLNRGLNSYAFEIVLPILNSCPTFDWRGASCKTRLVALLEADGKTKIAMKSICVQALSTDSTGVSLQKWKQIRSGYSGSTSFEAPFESQLQTIWKPNRPAVTTAFTSVPLWPAASSSSAETTEENANKTLWVVPPPSLTMSTVLVTYEPPSTRPVELEDVSLTWLESFKISALDDPYNSYVMSNFRINYKQKPTRRWAERAFLVQEVSVIQKASQATSTETIHRFSYEMNLMPQTPPGKEDAFAPTLMMRPTGRIPPPAIRTRSESKMPVLLGPQPFLLNLRSHHLPGLMSASTYVQIVVYDPTTAEAHIIARQPFYSFGVECIQYEPHLELSPQSAENVFKVACLTSTDQNGRNITPMEAWNVAELLAPTKRSWDPSPLYKELRLPMRFIGPTITVDDTSNADSFTGLVTDAIPSSEFGALPQLPLALHDHTTPNPIERSQGHLRLAELHETFVGYTKSFTSSS